MNVPFHAGVRSELCKSWGALCKNTYRGFSKEQILHLHLEKSGGCTGTLCTPGSAAPASQRGKRIKFFLKSAEPRHFNRKM